MASDVVVILRGEGEMVAGLTVKSRVNPRAVKVWVGSRTHFFQFMMKPALVRASMRTSRMWMACAWERAAPRQSST